MTDFCTAKLVCDGIELIRGVNWSEAETASAQCNDCRSFRARANNQTKARAAERNGLGRGLGTGSKWAAQSNEWKKEQIAEQTEIDRGGRALEPNKQAVTPSSKPPRRHKRPTKKQPVPLPRWGQSKQRDRLYTEATSRMLRRNKWAEHDRCELRLRGPFEDLEFCHTLSIATCKALGRLDWASDENNGFLLWGALNGPMERGFHWEMDGSCAFYVPPHGGDYYDWMKVLGIPTLWIEPTPEQVKYILMASDYSMASGYAVGIDY